MKGKHLTRRSWPDLKDVPNYGIAESAAYLRLSPSTLRAWLLGQAGFQSVIRIADTHTKALSFVNLVEAHVLAGMRRHHGVPLKNVRTAIQYVSQELKIDRPLANQQFETNGLDLFFDHLGQTVNASKGGQQAMAALLKGYLRRIDRDPSGVPIKLYPMTRGNEPDKQPKSVVIDPRVSFGRPVLVGTGIPTAVLAARFKAGESMDDLAEDYGAEKAALEEAIRIEFDLRDAA